MIYIVYTILLLVFSIGCTTFSGSIDKVKQACKSNVLEYDDGEHSFKCQIKAKDLN